MRFEFMKKTKYPSEIMISPTKNKMVTFLFQKGWSYSKGSKIKQSCTSFAKTCQTQSSLEMKSLSGQSNAE